MNIVIVNWNAGSQLKRCLDSLAHIPNISVTVVDNASTDGSAKCVPKYSGMTLIQSTNNLGFGKACNWGAQDANHDFILFLNPDAAVYADTINIAAKIMRAPQNKDVGICGVQLKDETGNVSRSCSRFPTPWRFVAHAAGLDRLFPRLGLSMLDWSHDRTRDVDQVIGAFFLVRRSVFETLKGFDEDFFVYFEEVDFSFRARQAGWRSLYLAEAQAFHSGGGTTNQVKAARLFYSLRSRLVYAHKHFSLTGFVITSLATLVLEPLTRTAFALSQRSWVSCKETWSSYLMLCKWLPKWISTGVTR